MFVRIAQTFFRIRFRSSSVFLLPHGWMCRQT